MYEKDKTFHRKNGGITCKNTIWTTIKVEEGSSYK